VIHLVFEKVSIVKGRKYKSLVRGYRNKEGKVRHKVIRYIGPVEPVNKRRNPNAGRKPKLKVRDLGKQETALIEKGLKNSKSFIKDRARILHLSNKGNTVKQICRQLSFHRPKVEKIIHQFNRHGIKIFQRVKSPGKPRRISQEDRAFILQCVNTEPEKLGLHYNNWSHKKLADYVKQKGIKVSPSQVGRIIKQDEIKYKKKVSWLYSNDPHFAKKNFA
jgi:transposase